MVRWPSGAAAFELTACYSPRRGWWGCVISNNASDVTEKAANENNDRAAQALGAYNGDINQYMSNVNSTLAAGNPYESKDYLTKQNLMTSGAMNSQNDSLDAALQNTVAATGTNSAALANTEAAGKRAGMRDLTNYEATRDTENQDKWLQEKSGLLRDQLEGANSEAGVYGHSLGAQSSDLSSMTQAQAAENAMWGNIIGGVAQGAGAVMAA